MRGWAAFVFLPRTLIFFQLNFVGVFFPPQRHPAHAVVTGVLGSMISSIQRTLVDAR